jgi:pyochelin biosynthesis protein PchC
MTLPASDNGWLRWYTPGVSPAGLRLACFPPAGSAASFYKTWAAHLPPDVAFAAVQYPGRENRLAERPLEEMGVLADGAAAALRPFRDTSLALFGHSMGAAVAYEVALRLGRLAVLFVSGCAPPHVHEGRTKRVWDDESILEDLKRLGGHNPSALENPVLLSLLMPALRADYALVEKYLPGKGTGLSCAVVGFHGAQDEEVTLDQMQEWSVVTTGPFRLRVFDGDHFFPLQSRQEVIAEIVRTMRQLS